MALIVEPTGCCIAQTPDHLTLGRYRQSLYGCYGTGRAALFLVRGYEIPRRIAFIDALPRSEVGKMLRREMVRLEIEAQAMAGIGTGTGQVTA